MKFFVLPLGNCDNDKGLVFTPGQGDGLRIQSPIWAGLIQADHLNILIDTGMHPDHIANPKSTFASTYYEDLICPVMSEQDFILNQFEKIDIKPEYIDFVINTHLHFDHAGCNAFFPKATFILYKEHFQYAIKNPEYFPPRYFLIPGLHYDLIEGDCHLIPGVEMIKCSGHVPGLGCIIIRLENSGTIVIAGDAISIRENMDNDQWGASWDPILARNSAARLSAIAEKEFGQIFFGHDSEWWKTVKQAPQYYD